jgi:hypothetical protein
MHIALINLGSPREVFSCIEALYTSGFYQKDKNVYYLVVRSEFLEQYDVSQIFDIHFIPLNAKVIETVLADKNAKSAFIAYPHLTNKYDIVINFSLTQASFFLGTQMSADQKLGPLLSEKGKLVLNDEWSQVLYADQESQQNFGWSKSESYVLIFQRLLSKMNLEYSATPIINNDFIKTYIESKNATQMCVFIPESLMGWNFWSQILLQATKRLEVRHIKLFAGDNIAAKVMQTLIPMGIDVDIFDRHEEIWPVLKASDYYIGPPIDASPLLSLLQVPSIFLCHDWHELYTYQTLNPMHYWQCIEGWENQGTQLAIALAPLVQKMINLEQIVDMAKTEGIKVPGLCFRFQGLKVQSTNNVGYKSAIAHSFRVLWQFYFYQADHFVTNKIQSAQDYEQIQKRVEVISLMVRAYEFMKHHCLKAIKKDELTIAESREIRNAINDIQLQIDTISHSFKEISSVACFFRAKLSAMSETDIQEAAETLVLTIQEAGSCYLAVKDLLEQSLMSYNNLTAKQPA